MKPPLVVTMPIVCPCPVCVREGAHNAYCSVHLADTEALDVPPCDCGHRDGVPRHPENEKR